ncbi:MAG: HEAT repeat domain-containing protein, partial [Gemmatimonadetes bacterium]|nr:HEAT repeat domain-containing protein [Gemmatimonadota bacterium]
MFVQPIAAPHPARKLPAVLGLLFLGVAGCKRAPEVALRPASAPEPPVEMVRLESPRVVSLDAAAVARLAGSVRPVAPVTVAEGFKLDLWASDTLLNDPIAIDVDNRGRVYVAQTDRRRGPDIDIRQHRDWMTASIGFQTVQDRRDFLLRELAPERSAQNAWLDDVNRDGSRDYRDLTANRERIFRIEDTTGDGLADRSTLLVEDFATVETDVAGGLLVHDDDIYVAVSPDFWRLRDTNGDGTPDTKQAIASGFHTKIAFGGHGMSGATLGPDGRIYWSIGDPGLNTVDREGKRWEYPNQGVIVRSNPDGSDFEVFAAGLRNTHEFAFDELGNLISVDNDGDHPGETERLVYITNGQDSGWRINWQFGKYTDPDNNDYKVWMDEQMYKPRFQGQAAWFTPPVAAYHAGPAGMTYNPGTALSERWRNHFFIAEFTGSANSSKIHAFRLSPSGAGFELTEDRELMRGILTTGLEFGPDGALYVADWIEGWGTKDRGRIWKFDTPAAAGSPERAQTLALLAAGFRDRPVAELAGLLRHADMRVRMGSQHELARRGQQGALLAAARQREPQLARLHGLWGIAQLARGDMRRGAVLVPFLRDPDPEVRAQAAKMLGDVRYAAGGDALLPLLQDAAPRARFFAAEALGRIAHQRAVQPLIDMLAANDDRDVYLRHAGTLALARIGQPAPVVALSQHLLHALRTAAVVTLRRMRDPGVARFLEDVDEYIVAEAARAINDDGSIEAAIPALARVLEQTRFKDEALLRRATNANLRLGTPEAARRVAAFMARPEVAEELRVDAIEALGVWAKPSPLDRVDGVYRGQIQRDTSVARTAIAPLVEPLLREGSTAIKVAVIETVARLDLEAAAPALLARLREDASAEVRVAALRGLRQIGVGSVEDAVRLALADRAPSVRTTALGLLPALQLPEASAAEMLATVMQRGGPQEQQSALATLGKMQGPQAQQVLAGLMDRLSAGTVPPEIELELHEAVQASGSAPLRARLDAQREQRRGEQLAVARRGALAWRQRDAQGALVVQRRLPARAGAPDRPHPGRGGKPRAPCRGQAEPGAQHLPPAPRQMGGRDVERGQD